MQSGQGLLQLPIHIPPTPEETAMRAAGNKKKAGRRTSFGSICMVIIGK